MLYICNVINHLPKIKYKQKSKRKAFEVKKNENLWKQ